MKILLILVMMNVMWSSSLNKITTNKQQHQITELNSFLKLTKKINKELEKQLLQQIEGYFYCPEKLKFDVSNIVRSYKMYWEDGGTKQTQEYQKCLCSTYIYQDNDLKKYSNTCDDKNKTFKKSITTVKKLEEYCYDQIRYEKLNISFQWGICDNGDVCINDNKCTCRYNQAQKKFNIENLINLNYIKKVENFNKEPYLYSILKKIIENKEIINQENYLEIGVNLQKQIYVSKSFQLLENKINLLKLTLISENIIDKENEIHIISSSNETFLLTKIISNDIDWVNHCDESKKGKSGDIVIYISKTKNIYIYKLIEIFNESKGTTELSWISINSLSAKYTNTRIFSGYCTGTEWDKEEYNYFNECKKDSECGSGGKCIDSIENNIPETRCLKNPNLNVYFTNNWFLGAQDTAIKRLKLYNDGETLLSNQNYYTCIKNQKQFFGNEEYKYWHRKTLLKNIKKE